MHSKNIKMRKDAFYFPHDSNAKDDPKCVMLIEQLGCEGYGIYWILVEILREQPNYCCPIALLTAFARRYNTTLEKMKTVVMNYGLFTVNDDKIFFSESLINRMLPLQEKREKARIAAESRWGKCERNADAMQTHSECNANLMPKREEKKREEKNNKNKSSDLSFVDNKFLEVFNTWLEYKKERKESYKSEKSIKMTYDKLVRESNNNPDAAKQMVENSIGSNWKGFFPLRENKTKSSDIGIVLKDTKNKDYKSDLW